MSSISPYTEIYNVNTHKHSQTHAHTLTHIIAVSRALYDAAPPAYLHTTNTLLYVCPDPCNT